MFGVGGCPVMAMAGGALGALVTGGDPLMGAMTAGISAGVSVCCMESPLASAFKPFGDEFLDELTLSTVTGSLSGGVTAEVFGGDFGQGAAYGSASAAAGYVLASALVSDTPAGPGEGVDPAWDAPEPYWDAPELYADASGTTLQFDDTELVYDAAALEAGFKPPQKRPLPKDVDKIVRDPKLPKFTREMTPPRDKAAKYDKVVDMAKGKPTTWKARILKGLAELCSAVKDMFMSGSVTVLIVPSVVVEAYHQMMFPTRRRERRGPPA
jgi:hypothetical protein